MTKRNRLRLDAHSVSGHDRVGILRGKIEQHRSRVIERRKSHNDLRALEQTVTSRADILPAAPGMHPRHVRPARRDQQFFNSR